MNISLHWPKRLLVYRFILLNLVFIAVAALLHWNGLILPLYKQDLSYLSYVISGLFVVGWLGITWAVLRLSRRADKECYRTYSSSEIEEASIKFEWLEALPEYLVGLGFLGTIIGFSIALGGADVGGIGSAKGAQAGVSILMSGMQVALNTTLLGASLAMWHQLNLRLYRTAFVKHFLGKER